MALKTNLRDYRICNKITQQDLAVAVGTTKQTIYNIETMKTQPTIELALRLAKFVNAPVEEIFELQ